MKKKKELSTLESHQEAYRKRVELYKQRGGLSPRELRKRAKEGYD